MQTDRWLLSLSSRFSRSECGIQEAVLKSSGDSCWASSTRSSSFLIKKGRSRDGICSQSRPWLLLVETWMGRGH